MNNNKLSALAAIDYDVMLGSVVSDNSPVKVS